MQLLKVWEYEEMFQRLNNHRILKLLLYLIIEFYRTGTSLFLHFKYINIARLQVAIQSNTNLDIVVKVFYIDIIKFHDHADFK